MFSLNNTHPCIFIYFLFQKMPKKGASSESCDEDGRRKYLELVEMLKSQDPSTLDAVKALLNKSQNSPAHPSTQKGLPLESVLHTADEPVESYESKTVHQQSSEEKETVSSSDISCRDASSVPTSKVLCDKLSLEKKRKSHEELTKNNMEDPSDMKKLLNPANPMSQELRPKSKHSGSIEKKPKVSKLEEKEHALVRPCTLKRKSLTVQSPNKKMKNIKINEDSSNQLKETLNIEGFGQSQPDKRSSGSSHILTPLEVCVKLERLSDDEIKKSSPKRGFKPEDAGSSLSVNQGKVDKAKEKPMPKSCKEKKLKKTDKYELKVSSFPKDDEIFLKPKPVKPAKKATPKPFHSKSLKPQKNDLAPAKKKQDGKSDSKGLKPQKNDLALAKKKKAGKSDAIPNAPVNPQTSTANRSATLPSADFRNYYQTQPKVDPLSQLKMEQEELDFEFGEDDDDDSLSLIASSTIFR